MLVRFLLFGRLRLVRLQLHPARVGQFVRASLKSMPSFFITNLKISPPSLHSPKAAPRAGLRPDDEGRRVLVLVEGAEARIVAPALAQLDPAGRDQVDDIDAGFDLVYCGHLWSDCGPPEQGGIEL